MRECQPDMVKREPGAVPTGFETFLRWLAAFNMLMTVPQVVSVWRHGGAGVSLASWLVYLASSVAWLVYGIRKRDVTIWVVCVGWILVNGAVVLGIVVKG